MEEKLFECSLSMTYFASTPSEAVRQFMTNIPRGEWWIDVKNIETGEEFSVDTEDYTTVNI